MNAMYSAIAFIVVAVLTYPLYGSFGGMAFAIAGISGIAVAILSYQVMSKKSQQQQQDLKQLAELLTSSNHEVVKSLSAHNEQIDENLKNLTTDLHNKLEKSWESLQDITQKNNSKTTEQIERIITQVNDAQKVQEQKQEELFNTLENNWNESKQQYENWFADQQKANKETLLENENTFKKLSSTLQTSQQHLVELIDSNQDRLLDKFRESNDQQLKIRQEEQQSWQDLLSQMKEKELAFEAYLNKFQHNFDEAQKSLGENILSKLETTNKGLMEAWQALQENQLSIREEEQNQAQATLHHFQQEASRMYDGLLTTWEKAQQDMLQMRKEEQQKLEHVITVVEEKEKAFTEYLQQLDEKTTESQNNFVELTSGATNTLFNKLVDLWNATQLEYSGYLTNLKTKEEANRQEIISLLEAKSEQSNNQLRELVDLLTASSNSMNDQIIETWKNTQDTFIELRFEEKQQLENLVSSIIEAKQAIAATIEEQTSESNNALLQIWTNVQDAALNVRKEEQEKLEATLAAVEQNEQAFTAYAKQLREQEHASILELLGVIEGKDQSMREHLTHQAVVFEEAQKDFKESFHVQTKGLYDELLAVWNKTQNEAAEVHHVEQETIKDIVENLKQQEEKFQLYLTASLETQQLAQKQFEENVSKFQDHSLQLNEQLVSTVSSQNDAVNHSILQVWNGTQDQLLKLRNEEQQSLQDVMARLEEKEQNLLANVEKLQQQLAAAANESVKKINAQITEKWTTTQQQLVELRSKDQKDVQQLIVKLDHQSNLFMKQLEQQHKTFDNAQQYYGKATDTIAEFTSKMVNQTKQINEQHERLVQAQEMLEKSITTTLKDILGNHGAVLTNAEKSLKSAIDVLQKEGLENQKVLIENVGEMVMEVSEMREKQEEILKDLTVKLNSNMRNLNSAITDSTDKQTRSVREYTMSLEDTLSRLDALINSEQTAQKELSSELRAQTTEMKESANLLRNTYNELKAMNNEDMKILAQLIK